MLHAQNPPEELPLPGAANPLAPTLQGLEEGVSGGHRRGSDAGAGTMV